MAAYKSRKNKKKKAFTLLEVIFTLGILAIIAVLIFPSLTNLLNTTKTSRDDAKIIFALEEAIEVGKEKEISEYTYQSNGIDIEVSISSYEENEDFKLIRASYKDMDLELVVKDEE